ncbi:hypothetical protein [uncultured Sphaerochaeta sp.]|uniref:hypothetical protein n=1 Tax=uncultured Sphaerochaeta sp. TaxID=886478 RepID=UPI002A0A69F5|nr:hypothetical protein [uncultured Sphaerochaeta sp.]
MYKYTPIQKYGPFRRESGTYRITMEDQGLLLHGFDMFQNKNPSLSGIFNAEGKDLSGGIAIMKDSYVHDPEGWYIQLSAHVDDGYKGAIASGPIEEIHPLWHEILRTQRLNSKQEAQNILDSLEQGMTYSVELTGSNEIVVSSGVSPFRK